jgi:DNA polymerase-3 subunit gamma/tau
MLSSSAFNAFLKTLEEPPSHAIFILATTEKHKIIPTILSRCQIFDFNRIRIEDIVGRLMYVAKNEGITAAEEALHIIGQKADGALRDALSIFDQIVSLSGKTITYKDVIENLNVLDYEYYFRCIDAAMSGDVSTVLLTFNEVLEKGFDGHNFISGLNSHLRDLLVSKDESTLRLLEATPSVKKRYVQQTGSCPVDFLFKALEIGNNCDLAYKSSKNPRLHIELSLIRLCRLMGESEASFEKKKPAPEQLRKIEEELPLPSKSEIIRQEILPTEKNNSILETASGKHDPVIEKPSKTFSIKDIISDEINSAGKKEESSLVSEPDAHLAHREEFTPQGFEIAWQEFTEQLKGEGNRIVSMFKSIRPELQDDQTIKIHLSNAAQKDIFILNYRPKFVSFLERKFIMSDIEIETTVDLTESNEILYSDEQKLNYLTNKYPILKEMKKTFNLDIT